MSLRSYLIKALASRTIGAALASSLATKAAIAPITSTNLRVDTLSNLGADAETRLDALEAKVNAIIAADALVAPVL